MMQNPLFYDYCALIDSCSFLKKYDALFRAFDLVYDQPDFPGVGRRGYRRSAFFKALIYKQSAHIKCISDLVRDLKSRPILAELCGCNAGRIPDASRFSRFLTDTNNSGIETFFMRPASGESIPLVEVTLPNNRTDGKVAKALLKKLVRVYGQKKGRIFLGDAGYDDREFYNFIVEKLKAEPFIPLNQRHQQPDKTLGPHALPLCPAGLEMKFAGITKEPERTRKKFRCPIAGGTKQEKAALPPQCPINHDLFCIGKCYGCTAYIDITDDHRSQVPRESKRFKDTYKCRTEAERYYFSRLGPREVEEMS